MSSDRVMNVEKYKLAPHNLVGMNAHVGRMYFRDITIRGRHPRLFCIQDNHIGEPTMFACSRDGEPSHEVYEYEIVTN